MIEAEEILEAYSELKSYRQSFWDPAWRAQAQLLFPREPTIFWQTGTKKWRPNNKMFDDTGREALIIAQSGLTSSWMSSARKWMQLGVEDAKLADRQSVRIWLEQTTADMLAIFAKSNVYGAMGRFVRDLLWATPVCYMEEDEEDVIRLYPEQVGSFVIDKDERGVINTVAREFSMSKRNIIRKFPNAVLPREVKDGENCDKFTVIHWVGPNDYFEEGALGFPGKKYKSIYIVNKTILSVGGYDDFRYLVGQWEAEGEDVYSTTPATAAYGNMRSLQLYAQGKLKAAAKAVDPALQVPASVSDVRRDPGTEVTVTGAEPVRNLEEIRYDWKGIQMVTGELKEAVNRAFFVPLFQHFLNSDRREQTAEEVRAKLDEQYAALSPVVSAMNQNVAAKLIDFTFGVMVKRKLLRPPPPELAGVRLKVQYISEFERAQQTAELRQTQAFAMDLINMIPLIQNPPDQVDVDELIQQLATKRQISQTIVRDDIDIAKRRAARAELQAQQMKQQQEAEAAKTLQSLGKAKTTPDTALGQLQS